MKRILILLSILTLSSLYAFSQKSYEDYVTDALDYTSKKDYPASEQAYKAALREEPTNPSNVMLMMNLGTIQRYLGKFEEALISYNAVLEQHPNLPYILENRARLYCDMNLETDALKDYTKILLNDPDNKDILYSRGLLQIVLRNLDEAEGDFKHILTLDSDNALAKSGIAMIMKRRGEWKEAEKLYSELIANDKRNGELYANRAECYLNLTRLRSLSDDLDKAVEYGHNDYSIYILKGQLRLAQYEKPEAKIQFEKAIEMGADEEIVKEFLVLCK